MYFVSFTTFSIRFSIINNHVIIGFHLTFAAVCDASIPWSIIKSEFILFQYYFYGDMRDPIRN